MDGYLASIRLRNPQNRSFTRGIPAQKIVRDVGPNQWPSLYERIDVLFRS